MSIPALQSMCKSIKTASEFEDVLKYSTLMEQTGSAELGQGVHCVLTGIETLASATLTRQEEK